MATLIWKIQPLAVHFFLIHLFIFPGGDYPWALPACQMTCPHWGHARLHRDLLDPSSWAAPPLGPAFVMRFLNLGATLMPPPHTLTFLFLSLISVASVLCALMPNCPDVGQGLLAQSKGVKTYLGKDWLASITNPQVGSLIRKKGKGCRQMSGELGQAAWRKALLVNLKITYIICIEASLL